jgi:hypothetical protein
MSERLSLWDQASLPDQCIYCLADSRYLSRRGDEWYCDCCARTWLVFHYSEGDRERGRLRVDKIKP